LRSLERERDDRSGNRISRTWGKRRGRDVGGKRGGGRGDEWGKRGKRDINQIRQRSICFMYANIIM
jgi:hypothetical protein